MNDLHIPKPTEAFVTALPDPGSYRVSLNWDNGDETTLWDYHGPSSRDSAYSHRVEVTHWIRERAVQVVRKALVPGVDKNCESC